MAAQIIDLSAYLQAERETDAAILQVVNRTLIVIRRYRAELERLQRERDDVAWRMPCDGEVQFGDAS